MLRKIRIGVDVGGTNTDICAIEENTGELFVYKLPSSLEDQSRAVVNGIKEIANIYNFDFKEVDRFIHGTTVATNAILEARGSKTALITTHGFRDLLEIGRQKRPDLYDLQADKPKTLIDRNLRFEVEERLDYKGKIIKPINMKDVYEIAEKLKEEDVKSVAIVFLNAYINSIHEDQVKGIIQEKIPDIYLSSSNEISNQFREFERLCGTVLNSFVGCEVRNYLESLELTLKEINIEKSYINHSNGGLMSINEASRFPIKTSLSGPAAGVIGASYITKLIGFNDVITVDIGGTSTDISLIVDSKIMSSKEKNISGYPVRIPSLDIATIGAGGGSIAWVDSGGILKVGPQSAGSEPGPACYDRGGKEATITDARVVLGHLNNQELLAGQLPINSKNSFEAVGKLAEKLNLDVYETAKGIIAVGNSNIIKEIKNSTVEKGYNPSDFALITFGGAGPLHGSELMKEMNIEKTIIPEGPGLLAAYGLLTEDMRRDFVKTDVLDLSKINIDKIKDKFKKIKEEAKIWLDKENIEDERRKFEYYFDMRYKGQNYEIVVPYNENIKTIEEIIDLFKYTYKKIYSYSYDDDIQIINFGLSAIGTINKPKIVEYAKGSENSDNAIIGKRKVYIGKNDFKDFILYDRSKLDTGNKINGPAIIEQMDSTTIIYADQMGIVDKYHNIILQSKVVS